MKKAITALFAACFLALPPSCTKFGGDEESGKREYYTLKYVNQFGYNVMSAYYLWINEPQVRDSMQTWRSNNDPIKKVKAVRYKDPSGKDIDRWTQMTDDYDTFVKSIEGVSTTYGYEFTLYHTDTTNQHVAVAVTLVYNDSPAARAGLKRGDLIVKADGNPIPTEQYVSIVKEKLMNSAHCEIGLGDGRTLTMNSVEMYCNPVHIAKEVGYLHFTSFTLAACPDLINVCKDFKAQGVSELILDLRYNGGGYVQTEEVMASMFAPVAVVSSGTVFMTEVYNDKLTEAWGEDETITYFRNSFKINGTTYDTAEANIGLSKIYAIMTGGSASASEALVCGLKPFVDLEIIGEQSYGKYCTGYILEGAKWYDDIKKSLSSTEYKNGMKYAANWGIYVMIGRYADRDGNTGCMPDGFTPDHEVRDNPLDGHQLGDPEETMLKAALTLAGYEYPAAPTSVKKKPATLIGGPASPKRETFGVFLRQESI